MECDADGGDRFGGAGGPGGNPKAALGGMGLLIFGTGALWMFNNALFNGKTRDIVHEMAGH